MRGGLRAGNPARLIALLVAATLASVLVACTDDGASSGAGGVAGEEAEPPDLAAKPDLASVLPDDRGDPPTSLQVEDRVEGEGEQAEAGARLTVNFVGASWSSGQRFDSTWDRDQPFAFTLGEGEVIPAWEEGLVGMRVGGRRVLIAPPDLAYGDRGSAAGIPPGETIVFIIDLLEIDTD